MISAFDMVQEEDYTPPIKDFIKEILEAREKDEHGFPVILHGKL